ncbi:MAG: hypothetical protein CVU46_11055 [Chloroflexi bacterium HGW-Chloroflexi-8]|jgi:hypothetical protein|nr:MAG: hypothetical protein CVU46_11055 [Chloroflexi bacterium HGW-Chloroflexi-8]
MNIQILAERNAKALTKIEDQAPQVCEKYQVPEEILKRLTTTSKDKAVESMQRIEAMGDLLSFLVEAKKADSFSVNVPSIEDIQSILEMPAKKLIEEIYSMDNIAELDWLKEEEAKLKNRKTVLEAIESRIFTLTNEISGG